MHFNDRYLQVLSFYHKVNGSYDCVSKQIKLMPKRLKTKEETIRECNISVLLKGTN